MAIVGLGKELTFFVKLSNDGLDEVVGHEVAPLGHSNHVVGAIGAVGVIVGLSFLFLSKTSWTW